MNRRRGQKSPALCATGTTGTPASTASRAPPSLYRLRVPAGIRVPSGKITTAASSKAFSALLEHLVRRSPGATVGDRVQHSEPPAEKWDLQ